jgi:hypothetical protein
MCQWAKNFYFVRSSLESRTQTRGGHKRDIPLESVYSKVPLKLARKRLYFTCYIRNLHKPGLRNVQIWQYFLAFLVLMSFIRTSYNFAGTTEHLSLKQGLFPPDDRIEVFCLHKATKWQSLNTTAVSCFELLAWKNIFYYVCFRVELGLYCKICQWKQPLYWRYWRQTQHSFMWPCVQVEGFATHEYRELCIVEM